MGVGGFPDINFDRATKLVVVCGYISSLGAFFQKVRASFESEGLPISLCLRMPVRLPGCPVCPAGERGFSLNQVYIHSWSLVFVVLSFSCFEDDVVAASEVFERMQLVMMIGPISFLGCSPSLVGYSYCRVS